MKDSPESHATIPLGIVVRRTPGVTRWADWAWMASAVMPGSGPADWRLLRSDGDVSEFHVATLTLELHSAETEAYLHGLSARVPSVYVVFRENGVKDRPLDAVLVTASPYEAQDYADNGEDIVEKVPMPAGLVAWIRDFTREHHQDEDFKKRRRDKIDLGRDEDGIGDPRIHQLRDVYRSPRLTRKGRLQ